MRFLLIHNYYLQRGGEDAVFTAEKALLGRKNHKVFTYVAYNAEVYDVGHLQSAVETIWSRHKKREIVQLIRIHKPDVVHFHNTFFRISPSAYYACKREGVPVVQTLHNYRLICPGALLMRGGRICEKCVGKVIPWTGVVYGCWRNSRAQTGVVVAMLSMHRLLRTWTKQVDIYIALTKFARRKFIEGGLPEDKIVVKPNFVYPDPGTGEHKGNFVLFVGRISPEKGVRTLLQAWQKIKDIPLKIVGKGPLLKEVQSKIKGEIEVLGRIPQEEVFCLMKEAQFLIFPSEWYEGFPVVLVEAFATGLPVLASNLGAMAEIVESPKTLLRLQKRIRGIKAGEI